MSSQFEEIERKIPLLLPEEKAALAHLLIKQLDESTDPDAEQLWLSEAKRRYEAYQRGELEARSGDDVMKSAPARLK